MGGHSNDYFSSMSGPIIVLFLFPVVSYLIFKIRKNIKNRIKWRKARKLRFPAAAVQALSKQFRPYLFLSNEEKKRLELKIHYFLMDKRIEATGGLELSEEMKLLIAAHACLLLVNLDLDEIYPGLKNIYVMEDSYVEKDNPVSPYTGTPLHVPRLGESWKRGPIILSWSSIEQTIKFATKKHNLIVHEFSHHLDQQDGYFDGTPELKTEQRFHLWAEVMGGEFKVLRDRVLHHQRSDIPAYGATNEAEFFAVCTEYFFTDPSNMLDRHPAIFRVYLDFFKIDPRRWC